MKKITTALKYAAFAGIATLTNIIIQRISLWIYQDKYSIYIAMALGTFFGLVIKYILDKNDSRFHDIAAKEMVELYAFLYIGYLILDETEKNSRKIFIANRYISGALANARRNEQIIKNEKYSDLLHADEILQ